MDVADYRSGTSANKRQPKPAPDTFNNHRSFFLGICADDDSKTSRPIAPHPTRSGIQHVLHKDVADDCLRLCQSLEDRSRAESLAPKAAAGRANALRPTRMWSTHHEVFALVFCGLKFRQDLDDVRQPSVRSELDDCVVSLEKRNQNETYADWYSDVRRGLSRIECGAPGSH